MPTDLYLFAHQDDEFGVFEALRRSKKLGHDIKVVYLTDGGGGKASPNRRNRESMSVLTGLGISQENMIFLGTDMSIPDGLLRCYLPQLFSHLRELDIQPDGLYTHAWEGGHADHDAAFLLGLMLVEHWSVERTQMLTFSTYNAYQMPKPFFRVFSPIPENGSIIEYQVSVGSRWRDFLRFFAYPSQWKSWIGLLPFITLSLVFKGKQRLQSPKILSGKLGRPHYGSLLYETRGVLSFDKFCSDLPAFIRQRFYL